MRTRRFLSLAFISIFICLCILFTGCSSPNGVYRLEKIQIQDASNSLTFNIGDMFEGVKVTEDMFTVKIIEDGTVIVRVEYREGGSIWGKLVKETLIGTWYEGIEADEYFLKFTYKGDEEVFEIKKKGRKLIFDAGEGITYILSK